MSLPRNLLRYARNVRASLKLQLGRAFLRLGRHEEAKRAFRDVLQDRGDDVRAYLFLGRIALVSGDIRTAQRELAEARRANPGAFEHWLPRILTQRGRAGRGDDLRGDDLRGDNLEELGLCEDQSHLHDKPRRTTPSVESSPFTSPSASPTSDVPSWIWYLDASGQGGLHKTAAGGWAEGDDEAADDEWSDFDDSAETSSFEQDFWSQLRGGDEAGSWWRDSNGPRDSDASPEFFSAGPADEAPDADELHGDDSPRDDALFGRSSFGEANGFGEAGEEDSSEWKVESPLAGFYEELANSKKDRENRGVTGDFSSEAEIKRFEDLPPIEKHDLENLDWDQLNAKLADEFEG